MELYELTKNEYQEFVSANNSLLFHNSWWLEIFRKWYHHKYYIRYYNISMKDIILAVLPIPIHRKVFLFDLVSVPLLTPYLGPVFSGDVFEGKYVSVLSRVKELNSLFARALKREGFVFYYPFSPWHVDLQPYKWAGFNIGVHYTYLIDLSKSLDELWVNMDKRRRNEIRSAERLDPEVVVNDIKSFVELNNKTFERQKVRYRLDRVWNSVFNECSKRDRCRIWTAYVGGEAMASLFLVWDNESAYYIGGGINKNSRGLMSLLMWDAIKFSREKGLKWFDFEGSDIPSIEKYFRKFGGEIKPVYHLESTIYKFFR